MKLKMWIVPVLIVTAFVALAILSQVQGEASRNPLAQFYNDGKITIPGGKFTPELQKLLFPPPAPKNYTTYALAESAYPTMAVIGTVHDIPQAAAAPPGLLEDVHMLGDAIARWFSPMPDWGAFLRGGVDWFSGLFAMDAKAVGCTGTGNCYWQSGASANWETTANWYTATNGGGTSGGLPGTGDAVHFDANSGGVTVTITASVTVASIDFVGTSVALATGGQPLTLGSTSTAASTVVFDQQSGSSNLSSSTVTVYGSWDCTTYPTCGATSYVASTLSFLSSNSQNVYLANSAYNVTFDSSNTTTSITYTEVHNLARVSNLLTIQDTAGTTPTVTFDLSASNFALNDAIGRGSITVGSRGILNGRASNIMVGGNWDSSAGTFTLGTSTVEFAVTGTVATVNSGGGATFYNVTVDASVISTASNSVGISRILTVNGSWKMGGSFTTFILNGGGATDPIVLGGSGSITTTTGVGRVYFFTGAGPTINIPAGTYTLTTLILSPTNTVAGLGVHFTLLGNVTFVQIIFAQRTSAPFYLDSQTFNVTLNVSGTGAIIDGSVAAAKTGIKATSGTWDITSSSFADTVQINDANSSSFWVSFGSSSWIVRGLNANWNTSVSTNSTDWSAGTGTVTFLASAAPTISPPAIGSTAVFNNVILDASVTTALTYSPAANLVLSGSLTVRDTVASNNGITLDLTASNYSLTATGITVAAGGTLNGRASTITDNGGWDSSAGAFTVGTSTVIFTASATIAVPTASQINPPRMYNVSVNDTVTLTLTTDVSTGGALTLNSATSGGIAGSGRSFFLDGSGTTLLTLSVGSSTSWCISGGNLIFAGRGGAYDIPGATYSCNVDVEENVTGTTTVTLLGNVTVNTGATSGVFVALPFTSTHIVDVVANTFNISANGGIQIGGGSFGNSSNQASLTLTTGTLTTSNTAVVSVFSTVSWIKWGSSTAHHIGRWFDASASASYDKGTGTVWIDTNTDAGVTFSIGLSAAEFNNLLFQSTDSVNHIITFTNSLVVAGSLVIQSSTDITTVDLNTPTSYNITAASLTVAAGGNINGRGGTITVSGTIDTSAGGFNPQTSTVVVAATANVSTAASSGIATFYNFTVNVGVTASLLNSMGFDGVVTANGTLSLAKTTGGSYFIRNTAGLTAPVVIGGSGAISGTTTSPNFQNLYFFNQAGSRVDIPSATYTNVRLTLSPSNVVSGFGVEFRILGNVSFYALLWIGRSGAPFYLNSQTFDVSLTAAAPVNAVDDAPVNTGVRFGVQATSGTWTISGTFNMQTTGETNFYIKFGATNWTFLGTYTNSKTTNSTDWSAGTGTVTFASPTSVTLTFGSGLGSTPEFSNATFDANTAGNITYTMGASLVVSGTWLLRNSAGQGNITTLEVTNANNYQITAGTIQGSTLSNNGILQARAGRIVTANWNWTVAGYLPTCFTAAFPCLTPAVVEFNANGTIIGKGNLAGDFWDVVIDAGVTTTFLHNSIPNNSGIVIVDQLTVNGTYLGGSPNAPLLQTNVRGSSGTTDPLVLGANADISLSGYLILNYATGGTTYNVPGGLYQQLAIEGGAITVNQTGNIATNQTPQASCGINALCELIIFQTAASSNSFTYYTNNYSIDVGVLFLGDVNLEGVTFHAGSSTITAREFAPIESSIVWLETSHLIIYPAYTYSPVAWIQERQAVVHGGSATIDVHGALRLWPFAQPGDNTAIYGENATFNILADAQSGVCAVVFGATRCPGDVFIEEAEYFMDFGNSVWNVHGSWKSTSTSTSWNASNGTLNFVGSGTITPASGAITQPEFPTLVFSGTYSLASGSLNSASISISGPLSLGGVVAGSGGYGIKLVASSGYATLSSWNLWAPAGPNIDFPIALTVPSATLTITVTNVSQAVGVYVNGVFLAQATANGNVQTMSVPGPWSTQDISITSPPCQGCGGSNPSGPTGSPTITITATPGADGVTYTLTVVAPSGYVIRSVTWSFGDGSTATGSPVVHTFAFGSAYTVTAQVSFTTGYAVPVKTTVIPLGPAQQLPGWVPLLIVLLAVILLLAVFLTDERKEGRKLWLAGLSLVVSWIAVVYVAVADFPSVIPRDVFVYFPLAVGAVSGLQAFEGRKKLLWIALVVAAVVVWWLTLAA